jgi:cytochrome c oxidase subunit II
MRWWLPPQGSTFAPEIDWLFTAILIITGITLVGVELGLIWFIFAYRERPGRKAFYTHGNTKAEIVWTTIPAVTMVLLGLMSNGLWVKIKGRNSVPANAYPVGVYAKQFEWWFTYPGPDGKLGRVAPVLVSKTTNPTGLDPDDSASHDDLVVRNQLHVPVGRPVVVYLTAEDVIHSFYVPQFRVRQDAVPGMQIKVWFEATVPGTYELGCSQLCGLGHYKMRAQVTVHTQADFDAWMQQRAAQAKGGPTS